MLTTVGEVIWASTSWRVIIRVSGGCRTGGGMPLLLLVPPHCNVVLLDTFGVGG